MDDFHHPRALRWRRGKASPEGFFLDSFDYERFTGLLLSPFAISFARMAVRDGCPSDPDDPRNRRYVEGQRLYLAACDPARRAGLVLDHR
ncbi:hypothetical protein [Lentzea sp.]|uniref:hypothetical protein n=1 Tax=Lentzea sp. TaxID=56099 RepID=UPI002ED50EE2